MILSGLDENKVLQDAVEFISNELRLQKIGILRSGEKQSEKSKFSFPLEPGITFQ